VATAMSTQEMFLKRFDELIQTGNVLFNMNVSSRGETNAKLMAWETSCMNLVEKVFGKDSDYYNSLHKIFGFGNIEVRAMYGIALLKSAKEDFQRDLDLTNIESALDSMSFLEKVCTRFHLIARQLRARHDERPTLDINDEYDVQYLMHALLKISFDDIRPEEWTPSYAGGSSRMDFLLKNESIVVETKKTRTGLGPKDLANELIIDIDRYKVHPDCKTLFCFIYDPEGKISNPEELERDLSRTEDNIIVKVVVAPKGF
jgi:hypothetical protein